MSNLRVKQKQKLAWAKKILQVCLLKLQELFLFAMYPRMKTEANIWENE